MLHKKRITFTVIRFFVLRKQLWFPDQNTASGSGGGERSERCPSGAFAEGENEVSESIETSSAKRSKRAMRRLRLRNRSSNP